MRVLVVGTLPPPGGAPAHDLAAVAAKYQADGDLVELLSPDPASAVHRVRRLDGLLLALELAWLSRRFDAVVLRIEDGLPCRRDVGRGTRAAILAALGASLSRYSEVTLRLDSPVPIPGGVGGRATRQMWAAADVIVVGNAADRDEVLAAPGVDPDHVRVEEISVPPVTAVASWPDATDPELRSAVLEVVRARANRDRSAIAARDVLTAPTSDARPSRRSRTRALGVAEVLARHGARRAVRATRHVGGALIERNQRGSTAG